MKLIFEIVDNQAGNQIMNLLAMTAASQGHEVIRWAERHAYTTNGLPESDAIFLWFGDDYFRHGMRHMITNQWHTRVQSQLFCVGPHVVGGKVGFQVDDVGIGVLSSRRFRPSSDAIQKPEIFIRPGPALVVLQKETSREMMYESPWFDGNVEFLEFLEMNTKVKMVVKRPPWSEGMSSLDRVIRRCRNVRWMDDQDNELPIKRWSAMVTINSPMIYNAMVEQVPVLTYGLSPWRYDRAVYCMDNCKGPTEAVTKILRDGGKTCLIRPVMRELVDFVRDGVWVKFDVAERLRSALEMIDTKAMAA